MPRPMRHRGAWGGAGGKLHDRSLSATADHCYNVEGLFPRVLCTYSAENPKPTYCATHGTRCLFGRSDVSDIFCQARYIYEVGAFIVSIGHIPHPSHAATGPWLWEFVPSSLVFIITLQGMPQNIKIYMAFSKYIENRSL